MQKLVRDFVDLVAGCLDLPVPVFEFGAYHVPGQEALADLRSLFPAKQYIGSDMRAGPGVDHVADICETGLDDDCAGTVLLLDTLEHVEYPRQALVEIGRLMREDAVLLVSSVMNFPIHEYPGDYWRFTPQGMQSLLRDFPQYLVESIGDEDFPVSILGLACSTPRDLSRLQPPLQDWLSRQQAMHRRLKETGWKPNTGVTGDGKTIA